MIISLLNNNEVSIGILNGVKHNAIAVSTDNIIRWVPLYDNFRLCEIKLLLKPLKKLTTEIVSAANDLPVKAFITPYYQQLAMICLFLLNPGTPAIANMFRSLNWPIIVPLPKYTDKVPYYMPLNRHKCFMVRILCTIALFVI